MAIVTLWGQSTGEMSVGYHNLFEEQLSEKMQDLWLKFISNPAYRLRAHGWLPFWKRWHSGGEYQPRKAGSGYDGVNPLPGETP